MAKQETSAKKSNPDCVSECQFATLCARHLGERDPRKKISADGVDYGFGLSDRAINSQTLMRLAANCLSNTPGDAKQCAVVSGSQVMIAQALKI